MKYGKELYTAIMIAVAHINLYKSYLLLQCQIYKHLYIPLVRVKHPSGLFAVFISI